MPGLTFDNRVHFIEHAPLFDEPHPMFGDTRARWLAAALREKGMVARKC
jgi:hypothetical protein